MVTKLGVWEDSALNRNRKLVRGKRLPVRACHVLYIWSLRCQYDMQKIFTREIRSGYIDLGISCTEMIELLGSNEFTKKENIESREDRALGAGDR